MPDLNAVTIAGNLTRDPEVRHLNSGRCVASLCIANTKHYRKKDGEKAETTTFVDVTIWDKGAELAGEHLKKGTAVIVEGRLKEDKWEDKTTGANRSKLTITAFKINALEWPAERQEQAVPEERPRPIEEPIPEDDIPF